MLRLTFIPASSLAMTLLSSRNSNLFRMSVVIIFSLIAQGMYSSSSLSPYLLYYLRILIVSGDTAPLAPRDDARKKDDSFFLSFIFVLILAIQTLIY
jgi:hypothetical protein